jgi:hypothetical protein
MFCIFKVVVFESFQKRIFNLGIGLGPRDQSGRLRNGLRPPGQNYHMHLTTSDHATPRLVLAGPPLATHAVDHVHPSYPLSSASVDHQRKTLDCLLHSPSPLQLSAPCAEHRWRPPRKPITSAFEEGNQVCLERRLWWRILDIKEAANHITSVSATWHCQVFRRLLWCFWHWFRMCPYARRASDLLFLLTTETAWRALHYSWSWVSGSGIENMATWLSLECDSHIHGPQKL